MERPRRVNRRTFIGRVIVGISALSRAREAYAQNPTAPTASPVPLPEITPAVPPKELTEVSNERKPLPANTVFVPMPVTKEQPWTGEATVTAYCLSDEPTSSGTPVRDGVIATDQNTIPKNSKIDIEGVGGGFVAEDTGSGVIGSHIDVWMSDCNKAEEFGVQKRRFRIR